jgi:hypothetical protein
MATKCFTVVRGKRMRVTRLDNCGNPPPPLDEGAFVVTKGFITVSLSAEIETGDDIVQKNADGDLCVNDRSRDQFKRWNIAAEFCEVDPALLSLMSNVTVETDFAGDIVGVRQPEGATVDSFALEVWTGVPGSDCVPGEPTNYGYLLIPFAVGGPLGDISIENGAATFSVNSFTRGSGGWGAGPYDVVAIDAENTPGPLAVPMESVEHLLMRLVTIDPPDPECGVQTMPDYDTGEGGEE